MFGSCQPFDLCPCTRSSYSKTKTKNSLSINQSIFLLLLSLHSSNPKSHSFSICSKIYNSQLYVQIRNLQRKIINVEKLEKVTATIRYLVHYNSTLLRILFFPHPKSHNLRIIVTTVSTSFRSLEKSLS